MDEPAALPLTGPAGLAAAPFMLALVAAATALLTLVALHAGDRVLNPVSDAPLLLVASPDVLLAALPLLPLLSELAALGPSATTLLAALIALPSTDILLAALPRLPLLAHAATATLGTTLTLLIAALAPVALHTGDRILDPVSDAPALLVASTATLSAASLSQLPLALLALDPSLTLGATVALLSHATLLSHLSALTLLSVLSATALLALLAAELELLSALAELGLLAALARPALPSQLSALGPLAALSHLTLSVLLSDL